MNMRKRTIINNYWTYFNLFRREQEKIVKKKKRWLSQKKEIKDGKLSDQYRDRHYSEIPIIYLM